MEEADQGFRAIIETAVAAAGPDPRDRIIAVFDAAYGEIAAERFQDCTMMRALAEFPDPELPAHRNAVAGKDWLRARLGELTGALAVEDPAGLADRLTLVLEGMLASGHALGPDGPAGQGRRLAELLLPPPPGTGD
ncbi:hypothetical protein ABH926_008100 [Catenulispora sp. GP43]|uniref:hypothetical protein n=1 Tax=Catenulispora sp. GP43 TaxID=3156263 RepID=UPI0035184E76